MENLYMVHSEDGRSVWPWIMSEEDQLVKHLRARADPVWTELFRHLIGTPECNVAIEAPNPKQAALLMKMIEHILWMLDQHRGAYKLKIEMAGKYYVWFTMEGDIAGKQDWRRIRVFQRGHPQYRMRKQPTMFLLLDGETADEAEATRSNNKLVVPDYDFPQGEYIYDFMCRCPDCTRTM